MGRVEAPSGPSKAAHIGDEKGSPTGPAEEADSARDAGSLEGREGPSSAVEGGTEEAGDWQPGRNGGRLRRGVKGRLVSAGTLRRQSRQHLVELERQAYAEALRQLERARAESDPLKAAAYLKAAMEPMRQIAAIAEPTRAEQNREDDDETRPLTIVVTTAPLKPHFPGEAP